jgi:transcriptional regulator with XRE-family HTH domain
MTPNEMLSMIAQLRRERNEARELLASEKITRDHVIKRGIEMQKERDEAREQNAKLREIADAFAVALERLDALYRSEQDSEAPMPRPDWLRRPLQMLDAELDRLKEGAK